MITRDAIARRIIVFMLYVSGLLRYSLNYTEIEALQLLMAAE